MPYPLNTGSPPALFLSFAIKAPEPTSSTVRLHYHLAMPQDPLHFSIRPNSNVDFNGGEVHVPSLGRLKSISIQLQIRTGFEKSAMNREITMSFSMWAHALHMWNSSAACYRCPSVMTRRQAETCNNLPAWSKKSQSTAEYASPAAMYKAVLLRQVCELAGCAKFLEEHVRK